MLVSKDFGVSVTYAIAPFSLFLLGTAFAPLYTPHLSEQFGRRPVYFVGVFISAMFTIGSSQAKNIHSLCATRFFAGLFGGPTVVLIEGTYADIWPASRTLTYYSNLTWASYLGAAAGPLINGFIVQIPNLSWRWTQYTPLVVYLLALLFATGMPETYPREIMRRIARQSGKPAELSPAPTGVTISQMAKLTVIDPFLALVTDPLVLLFTISVMFVFGTVFQFFIAVPTVLNLLYNFTPGQAGLAFAAAIGSIPFAVATCSGIEALVYPRVAKKAAASSDSLMNFEYRLIPAFFDGLIQTGALFWIGWTAKPTIYPGVPIVGTWFFVWGNMVILISYISYIFDAYTPQGTLSALTAGAVMRLLFAAATPLFILDMITRLGGNITYSIWGAISGGLISCTVILFVFGKKLRARSRFNNTVTF